MLLLRSAIDGLTCHNSPMYWTLSTALLSTAVVTSGALLQSATGLGAGLVVVPLLALISLDLVPGPMVFASLALSTTMCIAGRQHIDFENVRPILVGLLLGTVVAAAYIARLPLDALSLVFGVLILVAIGCTLRAPRFSLTAKGGVAAGALSGFLGTSVGIGAPVLAIVFQHYSGEKLRATLAFLYTLSSVTILLFLHLAGRFGSEEIISGLILAPGFVLGYLISPKLVAFIDRGYARPAVLILSTVSALLLTWRGVLALLR